MKEFLTSTLGIVLAVVVLVAVVFGGGYLALTYKNTFGVANENIDRKIFKQSAAYNEGVLDDLAKYKLEITTSKDDVEKSAIADLVNSKFANYDASKIEDESLATFLLDCRNGNYSK